MLTYQLALKDDIEFNFEGNQEKNANIITNSANKDQEVKNNPSLNMELSLLKKPLTKEDLNHEIKHSFNLDSIEAKNFKLFNLLEYKKNESKNLEIISETKKFSRKNKQSCNKKLEKFIDSTPFIVVMTLFTIFVLFASDIQDVCLPRTVDIAFDCIFCILFACFTLEIILSCIAKDKYLWSFFFWLDIIATISLIQDITFLFDNILTGSSSLTPPESFNNVTLKDINQGSSNEQALEAIQKVTTASRVTRVLRIIRIIRLIRIVKLYKNALLARAIIEKRRKQKEKLENYLRDVELDSNNTSHNQVNVNKVGSNYGDINNSQQQQSPDLKNQETINKISLMRGRRISRDMESKDYKSADSPSPARQTRKKRSVLIKSFSESNEEIETTESKISKILTESITKKVIIIIICMLVIIPIISDDFYTDDSLVSYTILAKYISNYWYINGINFFDFESELTPPNMLIGKYINKTIDENFPIISIEIEGRILYRNISWANYSFRAHEIKKVVSNDVSTEIKYSNLTETTLSAGLNIGRTLFVCLLLTMAAIYFEKDVKELVLEPLEIMIEIVDSVAKDPINAKNIENLKKGVRSTIRSIEDKKNDKNKLTEEKYEVKVIEGAILKISALLAIGFGEAGGEIIKENLKSGSDLNPMLKGKKRTAIFGFCDIRTFPQVNELLQEKTMVFVNEIADIVHSSVDKFGGAANKNIGDAFLMVWKFKSDESSTDHSDSKKIINDNIFDEDPFSPVIQKTADMAVLGFLTVIIRINKDLRILAYRNNPKINIKLQNYKVRMGFGLHMGWAIEGAIGSYFKVDASYLSPNVNMAARLEAATKIYGVNILISGILYNLLSDDLKDLCRLVDRVTVKGSKEPVKLYTVDLNLNISPQREKKRKKLSVKMQMERYQIKKQTIIESYKLNGNATRNILNKKSFKEILNTKRGSEFYDSWEKGLDLYFRGKWEEAGERFTECINICESDGPSKTLLGYLKSNNFQAPENWEGVRELTSKT